MCPASPVLQDGELYSIGTENSSGKRLSAQTWFKKDRRQEDEDQTAIYRRIAEDAQKYLCERRKDRSG
jgi:hypothetical protein